MFNIVLLGLFVCMYISAAADDYDFVHVDGDKEHHALHDKVFPLSLSACIATAQPTNRFSLESLLGYQQASSSNQSGSSAKNDLRPLGEFKVAVYNPAQLALTILDIKEKKPKFIVDKVPQNPNFVAWSVARQMLVMGSKDDQTGDDYIDIYLATESLSTELWFPATCMLFPKKSNICVAGDAGGKLTIWEFLCADDCPFRLRKQMEIDTVENDDERQRVTSLAQLADGSIVVGREKSLTLYDQYFSRPKILCCAEPIIGLAVAAKRFVACCENQMLICNPKLRTQEDACTQPLKIPAKNIMSFAGNCVLVQLADRLMLYETKKMQPVAYIHCITPDTMCHALSDGTLEAYHIPVCSHCNDQPALSPDCPRHKEVKSMPVLHTYDLRCLCKCNDDARTEFASMLKDAMKDHKISDPQEVRDLEVRGNRTTSRVLSDEYIYRMLAKAYKHQAAAEDWKKL